MSKKQYLYYLNIYSYFDEIPAFAGMKINLTNRRR